MRTKEFSWTKFGWTFVGKVLRWESAYWRFISSKTNTFVSKMYKRWLKTTMFDNWPNKSALSSHYSLSAITQIQMSQYIYLIPLGTEIIWRYFIFCLKISSKIDKKHKLGTLRFSLTPDSCTCYFYYCLCHSIYLSCEHIFGEICISMDSMDYSTPSMSQCHRQGLHLHSLNSFTKPPRICKSS